MRECGIEESIFSVESDNIRFDFWFYQLQGVGAVYVFRVPRDHLKSKDMIRYVENLVHGYSPIVGV